MALGLGWVEPRGRGRPPLREAPEHVPRCCFPGPPVESLFRCTVRGIDGERRGRTPARRERPRAAERPRPAPRTVCAVSARHHSTPSGCQGDGRNVLVRPPQSVGGSRPSVSGDDTRILGSAPSPTPQKNPHTWSWSDGGPPSAFTPALASAHSPVLRSSLRRF